MAAIRVADMSELIKELRYLLVTYEYEFDDDAIQTITDAANKIIKLENKVQRLEKRVSDAGWEAEARREQDEIARAKDWK